MAKAKKSDNAEIARRINMVYTLLIRGEPTRKIVRFSAETWGINRRMTENYIRRARDMMVADLDVERESLLAQAIAQRNDLYRRSYEKEKFWHCLEIAKDREALIGLYFTLDDHIKILQSAGYCVVKDSLEASVDIDQSAHDFFEDGADFEDQGLPDLE